MVTMKQLSFYSNTLNGMYAYHDLWVFKWWSRDQLSVKKQVIQLKLTKCVGGLSFAYKNDHNSGMKEATDFKQKSSCFFE